ncbi:MAG: hypothetical protein K8F25_14260, partial [Fimbriimonadaceae bacterium]|nr:hypothetical protein [Alphaproteobacteria bacterium]
MHGNKTTYGETLENRQAPDKKTMFDLSIRSTRRIILLSFASLVLFASVLISESYYYQNTSEKAFQNIRTAKDIGNTILFEEEILTSSVRLAAATGDQQWVRRYYDHLSHSARLATATGEQQWVKWYFDHLSHIEEAFLSVHMIATQSIWQRFQSTTGTASDRLVAIEAQLLDLVVAGNLTAANNLL